MAAPTHKWLCAQMAVKLLPLVLVLQQNLMGSVKKTKTLSNESFKERRLINMPTIKQPSHYIDYSAPHWMEDYDHVVVNCECGKLMERGMGLCDSCIERESLIMQKDLHKILGKNNGH